MALRTTVAGISSPEDLAEALQAAMYLADDGIATAGYLSLALGNDTVPREHLQATLDRQTSNDREQRVFLRADGAVAYRELMEVMNRLRQAGYLKIALVGLEDTGQGAGKP